jgi:hypothetical protein
MLDSLKIRMRGDRCIVDSCNMERRIKKKPGTPAPSSVQTHKLQGWTLQAFKKNGGIVLL